MPSQPVARESRRSTRVDLKVVVEVQGINTPLTCEGETIVVNLHGALMWTSVPLRSGMKISLLTHRKGGRAAAKVVYVDSHQTQFCGIQLARPENIWGVSLPPDDWRTTAA